jgi:hypothetical protein
VPFEGVEIIKKIRVTFFPPILKNFLTAAKA